MATKINLGEVYKINYCSEPAKKFDEVVPYLVTQSGFFVTIIAGQQKGATLFVSNKRISNHGLITQHEFDIIDWKTGKLGTFYSDGE